MSEFSNRFRQLKEESNLTLKDLAEELGISVPNLSYYMKGREPSYDILISIANYFNVTTDWLIGRTDARSTTYESLDNEIIKKIKQNNVSDISTNEIQPLSIFKDDYYKVQDKIIDFMAYYYCLLMNLELLENNRSILDFSETNETFMTNIIEAFEYQTDFLVDAQWTILSGNSDSFFEYYFNSLIRIDLLVDRYKMFIATIIKLGTANFDGNKDKLSIIADFINHAEQYGKKCISDVALKRFNDNLDI